MHNRFQVYPINHSGNPPFSERRKERYEKNKRKKRSGKENSIKKEVCPEHDAADARDTVP
jgi:hypothetical protein